MIAPFPLYVDEISPDKIKATVSTASTAIYNIRTMSLDMPSPHRDSLFNGVNGIVILPVGKFICMLVRDYSNISMIILDLIGKEELAEKMAGTPSMRLARLINESVFNRADERIYGRTTLEYATKAFKQSRRNRQRSRGTS